MDARVFAVRLHLAPESIAGGTGWPGLGQDGKPSGRALRRLDRPGRRLSQDGEVISALLGLRRGRKITEREADAAAANLRTFPIERQDVLPLWPRIKGLHASLPAYDAQYVALAEVLGVSLVTADARVAPSGAARRGIEVFGAPPST